MGIGSATPFRKRDIFVLFNEEFCIIASVSEVCNDASSNFTVEFEFEKSPIGRAFAMCVLTMAVVN